MEEKKEKKNTLQYIVEFGTIYHNSSLVKMSNHVFNSTFRQPFDRKL